jgi:hypothetical protein
MQRWRASALLLGAAAALALGIAPAAGQRDAAPESLLPPGFGEPDEPPLEKEAPGNAAAPATPAPAGEEGPPPPTAPQGPGDQITIENAAAEDLEELAEQTGPPPIELPEHARRPTDVVGPLRPGNWGLGMGAFGNAHGRFLTSLMGRLDAPLPSRWSSILLRRALMSEVPAPGSVNEVDWVAERAWLLLRMGEADGARSLVQAIDVDRYTPRMFTVAVQAALATADPAALCPLVGPGRAISDEPVWPLADAMCAALAGEAARASQLIDQARRRSGAGGIDILLAEKVIGSGTNTRRAVTIQWEGVTDLNSWRFGLASATGLEVPANLLTGAGPQVRAWQARAPMLPLEQRVQAAEVAASLGVFSHAALVEIHSLLADQTDASELDDTIGGRLRRAYLAGSVDNRLDAIRGLWDEAKTPEERHARRILTATAAARIPPSEERANRAADLIASMLAAGLDRHAARWSGIVEGMGDEGDRGWALLAVGSARAAVDISAGRVEAFVGRDDSAGGHRSRMLVAALAGLGRVEDPAGLGLQVRRSRWSNMIAAAARNDQPGTVALLAAVGMQTADWRGVPPSHLYHVVRALRDVGLEYEARMIAAEALSRL